MPIYDYQCTSCEHELEVIQKISEAQLTDCPECSKPDLQKKVSAPSFRLSGKGWYETDFKDSNQKNLTSKDNGKSQKEANTPSKQETKKESKSAPCGSGSCGHGHH